MNMIDQTSLQAQLREATKQTLDTFLEHLPDEMTTLDEYEQLLQGTIHQIEQQILSGVIHAYGDMPAQSEAPSCECGARMNHQGIHLTWRVSLISPAIFCKSAWHSWQISGR